MRSTRSGIDKECHGRRHALACAGILALAAALTASAGPSRAAEGEPFRLCADPTNLPFSSDNPAQPGLYVEIGQALARALGQPITFDWYKSYFGKRTVRATLLGKQCDAMIGLPLSDDFMGPAVIDFNIQDTRRTFANRFQVVVRIKIQMKVNSESSAQRRADQSCAGSCAHQRELRHIQFD